MAKISRDDIKKRGLIRFIKSFGYSIEGLKYAYKYEQSMLIHVIATICVLCANIFFQVSGIEWLITLIAIGMVLSAELINSAIEAVVDLETNRINPLAKLAKDTASSATLIFSFTSLIIGLIIFIPKIGSAL